MDYIDFVIRDSYFTYFSRETGTGMERVKIYSMLFDR